jgi:hypothetical protein
MLIRFVFNASNNYSDFLKSLGCELSQPKNYWEMGQIFPEFLNVSNIPLKNLAKAAKTPIASKESPSLVLTSYKGDIEDLKYVSINVCYLNITYDKKWPLNETQDGQLIVTNFPGSLREHHWIRNSEGYLQFKSFSQITYRPLNSIFTALVPMTKAEQENFTKEQARKVEKERAARKKEEEERKLANLNEWQASLKKYYETLTNESKRVKKILELEFNLENYPTIKEGLWEPQLMLDETEVC